MTNQATDGLEEATERLRRMQARHEAERKAARFRPNGKFRRVESWNADIVKEALAREPIPGGNGAEFWITYSGMRESWLRLRESQIAGQLPETMKFGDPDALNGYVAFPKRRAPKLPHGTGNIVQYMPVHGGITLARKDSYMAVWGFDTMHCDSEKQPRTDQDWIRANCWVLYRGLVLAEKLWPEFRRAPQHRRAELAQQLLDLIEEQPLMEKLGFEAMIGTFFGGRVGDG
jgi:hypothetical protein